MDNMENCLSVIGIAMVNPGQLRKEVEFQELVILANGIYRKDMKETLKKRFRSSPLSFDDLKYKIKYEILNKKI